MSTLIIPKLPPLDEFSLVGIWMSTVLYGMKYADVHATNDWRLTFGSTLTSILLYASCMYILVRRHTDSRSQWILMLTSTSFFVLATISIGASLRQLIDSLIDAPKTGIPEASILYWADLSPAVCKVKGYAYTFIDSMQDFVLIWRLYVVWGEKWYVAALPLLLELVHLGLGLAETAITTGNGHLPQFSPLLILAWAIVVVINVGTTLGIAGRLLYIERSMALSQSQLSSTGPRASRYSAPIFTMIESGAIFTTSTVVLLVLYAVSSPLLQTVVNIATQLAATTPLLIIVRVGFGLTHGFGNRKKIVDRFGKVNSKHHTTSTEINIFRSVKSDTETAAESSSNNFQLDEYKPSGTNSNHSTV